MSNFNLDELNIVITEDHPLSDIHWIKSNIIEHHAECLGDKHQSKPEPVSIIIKDVAGKRIAGAFGYAYLNVFTVEGMFIDKAYRRKGIGRKLSILLQNEAEKRNCHTATLETYSFANTKNFYNSLGVIFSKRIYNSPKGHCKYILINKLEKDKNLFWRFIVFLQSLHTKINKKIRFFRSKDNC